MKISIFVLLLNLFSSSLFAADWLTLKTCGDAFTVSFSIANEDYQIIQSYADENGANIEEEFLKGKIKSSALLNKESLKNLIEALNEGGVLKGDLESGTYFVLDGQFGLYVATNDQDDTHALLVSLSNDEDGPWYFGSTRKCNK